jgi:hypothetical protein
MIRVPAVAGVSPRCSQSVLLSEVHWCELPRRVGPCLQVRSLGSGNFGVCQLMKDEEDGEQVAVKFLPRGSKVRALTAFAHGPVPALTPLRSGACFRLHESKRKYLDTFSLTIGSACCDRRRGGTRRACGVQLQAGRCCPSAAESSLSPRQCVGTYSVSSPGASMFASGLQIDVNVEREIVVHSQLCHPNVIGFKRVRLAQLQHISASVSICPCNCGLRLCVSAWWPVIAARPRRCRLR